MWETSYRKSYKYLIRIEYGTTFGLCILDVKKRGKYLIFGMFYIVYFSKEEFPKNVISNYLFILCIRKEVDLLFDESGSSSPHLHTSSTLRFGFGNIRFTSSGTRNPLLSIISRSLWGKSAVKKKSQFYINITSKAKPVWFLFIFRKISSKFIFYSNIQKSLRNCLQVFTSNRKFFHLFENSTIYSLIVAVLPSKITVGLNNEMHIETISKCWNQLL